MHAPVPQRDSRGLAEAGLADAVDEALARLAGVEAAVS